MYGQICRRKNTIDSVSENRKQHHALLKYLLIELRNYFLQIFYTALRWNRLPFVLLHTCLIFLINLKPEKVFLCCKVHLFFKVYLRLKFGI